MCQILVNIATSTTCRRIQDLFCRWHSQQTQRPKKKESLGKSAKRKQTHMNNEGNILGLGKQRNWYGGGNDDIVSLDMYHH